MYILLKNGLNAGATIHSESLICIAWYLIQNRQLNLGDPVINPDIKSILIDVQLLDFLSSNLKIKILWTLRERLYQYQVAKDYLLR